MALDKTRLKNAIAALLEPQMRTDLMGGDNTPYPQLTSFCGCVAKSIADAVVDEIKNNGELNGAQFSGTFSGTVTGATCSTVINGQSVTGGIK